MQYLDADSIDMMTEENRLQIWIKLSDLVAKHRRFPDAQWAMRPALLDKIANIADRLTPKSPAVRYGRLFSDRDYYLVEGSDNWEEGKESLKNNDEK